MIEAKFIKLNKKFIFIGLLIATTVFSFLINRVELEISKENVMELTEELSLLRAKKEVLLTKEDLAPLEHNWQTTKWTLESYGLDFIPKPDSSNSLNSWHADVIGSATIVPAVLNQTQRNAPIKVVQIKFDNSLAYATLEVFGAPEEKK